MDRNGEREREKRKLGMGVKVWPSYHLNLSLKQIMLKEQSSIILFSNLQTFYG